MRILLKSMVLLCAGGLSGCFISENAGPGHPCSADSDCPGSYHCIPVSEGQGSCEVRYPPSPLEVDAGTGDGGTPDAGLVPTWCKDIQPILAANCVSTCHGASTSGSGRADFRLDMYQASGGVLGARDKADRVKARAVDQRDMPPAGPAPSDAERALLSRWVGAGTPYCADGGTP